MTYAGSGQVRCPTTGYAVTHYYYLSRINCKWFIWCELSAARLFAQEFFEGGEFGFGHVQILFGGLGVLFLHGRLGFGDVGPHALLGGDDVAAETITRGGLLSLEVVQGLRYGGGAAVDVVVELLD